MLQGSPAEATVPSRRGRYRGPSGRAGVSVELPQFSKGVGVGVGPERDSGADQVADDSSFPPVRTGARDEHTHPIQFADLQSSGRFVRDSRVGGMFHAGQVPLREDCPNESLHVSLGRDNRVSVHIDRFSPLAKRKPGRRTAYSVRRVILHNVGIVVDYVILVFHRRFGEQRCELVCERICDDDHDDVDPASLETKR